MTASAASGRSIDGGWRRAGRAQTRFPVTASRRVYMRGASRGAATVLFSLNMRPSTFFVAAAAVASAAADLLTPLNLLPHVCVLSPKGPGKDDTDQVRRRMARRGAAVLTASADHGCDKEMWYKRVDNP
jgi:poly(3-hydroxybutyrate) depolymerase